VAAVLAQVKESHRFGVQAYGDVHIHEINKLKNTFLLVSHENLTYFFQDL
jgi:hypothetical protein